MTREEQFAKYCFETFGTFFGHQSKNWFDLSEESQQKLTQVYKIILNSQQITDMVREPLVSVRKRITDTGFTMNTAILTMIDEKLKEINRCKMPPAGWYCTRDAGHEGPCAVLPEGESNVRAPTD